MKKKKKEKGSQILFYILFLDIKSQLLFAIANS